MVEGMDAPHLKIPSPRPAALARTRPGLVAAAGLLAVWQLAAPAAAQVANPGYSENEYFRLDWYYDLPNGRGEFTLTNRNPQEVIAVALDELEFWTFGMRFDDVRMNGGYSPLWRRQIGQDYLHYLSWPPILRVAHEVEFEVWYPTVNVAVANTSIHYGGVASAILGPITIPSSTIDFVTIQAVPDPAALSLLAVGAAAMLTRRRVG